VIEIFPRIRALQPFHWPALEKSDKVRIAILAILILVITILHYSTQTTETRIHDIFRRLYYIPIILGGLWFSLRGGFLTALVISVIYAPHVVLQWGTSPAVRLEQYLEILLYNLIGLLAGFLTQREKNQKLLSQKAAGRLERSFAKLKDQADQILEIEEQLRRADRLSALGELSAGLAHEIRNPLGSIRMTTELLKEGFAESDPRLEFADILIRETERLNMVVNNFLQFAHPAAEGERERFCLNETLEEILQLMGPKLRENQITLRFGKGDVPLVSGSRGLLKQVFLNLVLNAAQAMPKGGTLSLASEFRDGRVWIRVADTGHGIPAEHLERIFNPFFTTRKEGTGLGLAITHRIVQSFGGNIEVESTLGQGTCFLLTLPASAE
jgi:two-component system sensor histidine kinase HydH